MIIEKVIFYCYSKLLLLLNQDDCKQNTDWFIVLSVLECREQELFLSRQVLLCLTSLLIFCYRRRYYIVEYILKRQPSNVLNCSLKATLLYQQQILLLLMFYNIVASILLFTYLVLIIYLFVVVFMDKLNHCYLWSVMTPTHFYSDA